MTTHSQQHHKATSNSLGAKGAARCCEAPILPPERVTTAPTHPSDAACVAGGFYDVAEALTNAGIGLLVSLLLTWLWLGFTPIQSAGITAVFFIASTVRSFIIRRCFRWVS